MNKNPRITIHTETKEQFLSCITDAEADTVYMDIRYMPIEESANLIKKAHANGKRAGLRFPEIYRDKNLKLYEKYMEAIKGAEFDIYMFGNMEDILLFNKCGMLSDRAYALDSSIYLYNSLSAEMLITMLMTAGIKEMPESISLPKELNKTEIASIENHGIKRELTVYGRQKMMVSAQCINKTVSGCDGTEKVLWLKDRTGALMPVKNSCRLCMNTIYNSVPTVLFDLKEELDVINPDIIRYEFTTESRNEVKNIMGGILPGSGKFTRGHIKKSIL